MATKQRYAKIGILLAGLGFLAFLRLKGPHEQHVRYVLGDGAGRVTGLDIQYVDADGDVAREARFSYVEGTAPRVVSHEPDLRDGDYKVKVDVATRERRVSVERSVKLGGGSVQVDVAAALLP